MNGLRFFRTYFLLTLGRLRQQRWLLAGLVLLCVCLPLGAGRAAEYLLSQGVNFSGVTLALTAPEGDDAPRLLEQYMGDMDDIAQYCRIISMGEEEALAALARGEVTAILVMPENFIRGVMYGDNPDLRLIVDGSRPLESLLLLWVGQSASDILSAFQSGVYAVLDLYDQGPPPGLTRDQVVMEINLDYISLALNRTGMFHIRQVLATQTLPIPLHYTLSLLACFALSAAPAFVPLYSGGWLRFQRRLRSVGRGTAVGCVSGIAAGVPLLLLLLAPGLLLTGRGEVIPLLAAAALTAVFCSLFCALCCLVTGSAAGCGAVAFTVSLLSLALAGGIVPPVLLPGGVQKLAWLSPVSWLRQLAAWPMGYEVPRATWVCLALSAAGMTALSLLLYRRRADRQEVEE